MIAVIAHDAGGAEILSAYVRQQGLKCLYALAGPARTIFERKLGAVDILSVEDAVDRSDSILCGTSWQATLECDAIRRARAQGKRAAAFLDHWVNYRERFLRSGAMWVPDEIWVGDAVAEAMATTIFPGALVRLVDNPYFEDIRKELAHFPSDRSSSPHALSVLYVCAPIREQALLQFGDEHYWGYVEEEALRYFLANIAALGKPIERIVIRLHPSEALDKYDWARREFDLPIQRGGARTLIEEIADSDIVAGCASMAMVVGLLAGKRVITCIPPEAKAFRLPQPEIEPLHTLVGAMPSR